MAPLYPGRHFRRDSARREAATQKAFRDIRTVGPAIVKALNRHTQILEHLGKTLDHHSPILERHGRILERIDRKLGARPNGRRGREDGGHT